MLADELLQRFPIVTDQMEREELRVILRELEQVLRAGVDGAIVEFGCYQGTTALFVQRLLDSLKYSRELHVYDSFAGLPDKTATDASPAGHQFVPGSLSASKSQLITHFKKAGLKVPRIHKAWFSDVSPSDVPDSIALAFCDGDYYDSIRDSLRLVWPKLAAGGVVIVDDYSNEALPGARRAVHDFFQGQNVTIKNEASLAIIKKVHLSS